MTRSLSRNTRTKGVMEQGSSNTKSRISEKDGEIMRIASRQIISTYPSNTIKNAAATMRQTDVRRLPVLRAGTNKLEGLITSVDILDYMGGGPKYKIIEDDFGGNFLKAINCPVQKIMREAQYLAKSASVADAAKIIVEKRSSCIPIVDDEENLAVVGLVTERDILPADDPDGIGVTVKELMHKNPITASLGMMISDVSKIMVRNQLRRLPVIKEDEVVGVVTSTDVLGYLQTGHFKGAGAEENLSTRVEEIMIKEVTTVKPDDDLNQVINQIKFSGYGGFPVIDKGRLTGILTITDILKWIYGR